MKCSRSMKPGGVTTLPNSLRSPHRRELAPNATRLGRCNLSQARDRIAETAKGQLRTVAVGDLDHVIDDESRRAEAHHLSQTAVTIEV